MTVVVTFASGSTAPTVLVIGSTSAATTAASLHELRHHLRADHLRREVADLQRLREAFADVELPALPPLPRPSRQRARGHQQRAPMVRQRSWLVIGRRP